MKNNEFEFIMEEIPDKPIKVVHSDYSTEVIDNNYVFSKKEYVVIQSEDQLIEYIRLKLREGFNVNINNNSSITIDINL